MLFIFYGLFALAVYIVSPGRVRWWAILAGNALFYALSGREPLYAPAVAAILFIVQTKNSGSYLKVKYAALLRTIMQRG